MVLKAIQIDETMGRAMERKPKQRIENQSNHGKGRKGKARTTGRDDGRRGGMDADDRTQCQRRDDGRGLTENRQRRVEADSLGDNGGKPGRRRMKVRRVLTRDPDSRAVLEADGLGDVLAELPVSAHGLSARRTQKMDDQHKGKDHLRMVLPERHG